MLQEISPHIFKNEFCQKAPSGESCFFYFHDQSVLMNRDGTNSLPAFSQLGNTMEKAMKCSTYLFSIDDVDYYLMDETEMMIRPDDGLDFKPVNTIRDILPVWVSFAAATGYELYRFYRDNRYCGRCGTPMKHSLKERAMTCPDCHNINYPKIAPAVVVAVTNGDRLLLTKYAGRDYKRYALVAGYTEFGETLEETVRREVMEEVGIRVKNIRYYKNQPWAFSDSLLVGFFAELDGSPQIRLDESELSTAIWVNREDISDDYTSISLTHEMITLFKHGSIPESWSHSE